MSIGLNAAMQALTSARIALQTVGHNIANANTPGYSRQRVILATDVPFTLRSGFQIGTGVRITDIQRIVDANLEDQLRMQTSLTSGAEIDLAKWTSVENVFNEPAGGISSMMAGFFDDIAKLQNDPSQRALRGSMLQSAQAMTLQMNLVGQHLGDIKTDVFDEVTQLVRDLNAKAQQVASLNTQIHSIESTGARANDLRDTRDNLVKEMADITEIRSIEKPEGVTVLLAGASLVSGANTSPVQVNRQAGGSTTLTIGSSPPLRPTAGQIAVLLQHEVGGASTVLSDLDALAYHMALEFNRIHTTGVPAGGAHHSLVSHYAASDRNKTGRPGDELLRSAGLPFPVQRGELFVTVSDDATGAVQRTRLDIDPSAMTLEDLADELSAIGHLSASVDPTGRLRVLADSGYGFDFGNRLDPAPDSFGSFGGAAPSLGSAGDGPFDLSAATAGGPATFTVDVGGTAYSVDLAASEFVRPDQATAEELAAAINADIGSVATAKAVAGRLVIRANTSGTGATIGLTDGTGSPLAAVGMPTGSSRSGQAVGVSPAVFGTYTGSGNGKLVFVPDVDGQVGVTQNLTVGVFDSDGARVATIDIGAGYSPGDHIDVADGVIVSFAPGQVSATANDVFEVDTIADADTSDVLVAIGLNSLFHGTTAADLEVNPDLIANPDLLATGLSGASGDPANILRMTQLRGEELGGLGSQTIEDFYNGVVGEIGFRTAAAQGTVDAQTQLEAALQQQRDSVSGVNVDEEMVDLVRYQQAFDAMSRFVEVVNEVTNSLINIGR